MRAVAHVVINRSKNSRFPDSICEVVKQKNKGVCQFQWVCDKIKTRFINNDSYEVAVKVLNGETSDPTKGALFFHNKSVDKFERRVTAEIGNHIFYK